MKKGLKILFISVLTSIVLISGNGVVLAIHTCIATANKNISLFEEDACCSGEKKECEDSKSCSSFHPECCTSEYSYHKVTVPFLLQKSFEIDVAVSVSQTISFEPVKKQKKFFSISDPVFLKEDLPFRHCQLLI